MEVNNDKVVLHGEVHSAAEREEAEKTAWSAGSGRCRQSHPDRGSRFPRPLTTPCNNKRAQAIESKLGLPFRTKRRG